MFWDGFRENDSSVMLDASKVLMRFGNPHDWSADELSCWNKVTALELPSSLNVLSFKHMRQVVEGSCGAHFGEWFAKMFLITLCVLIIMVCIWLHENDNAPAFTQSADCILSANYQVRWVQGCFVPRWAQHDPKETGIKMQFRPFSRRAYGPVYQNRAYVVMYETQMQQNILEVKAGETFTNITHPLTKQY